MRRGCHDGQRALLAPADEPADPARPADLDVDGHAVAGCEPNTRPDGAAAQADRHRLPARARHGDPLDVPGEAGQRDPRDRSATRRRPRSARPATPHRQPPATRRDTSTVRNHMRNMTFQYGLRSERMTVPRQAEGFRASSHAPRSTISCAASGSRASAATAAESRTSSRSSTPTRKARSRRGHDRGPQDRDAARQPARLRRGRRVRRRRQGKLAERDRPRHATKSSPATRSSPRSPSCASGSRARRAAPPSHGRSGRPSSSSASISTRCRAGPSSGDFLCVSRE